MCYILSENKMPLTKQERCQITVRVWIPTCHVGNATHIRLFIHDTFAKLIINFKLTGNVEKQARSVHSRTTNNEVIRTDV